MLTKQPVSRSRFGRILLPVLLCLGCIAEGSAQTSGTQGWVIGLEFGRAAVSFGNDPGDGAALVGARIGRAVNRIVTPYLGVAYADIESRGIEAFDNVTFAHVDLGVRLRLPEVRRRWVPYADLALTYWPPEAGRVPVPTYRMPAATPSGSSPSHAGLPSRRERGHVSSSVSAS